MRGGIGWGIMARIMRGMFGGLGSGRRGKGCGKGGGRNKDVLLARAHEQKMQSYYTMTCWTNSTDVSSEPIKFSSPTLMGFARNRREAMQECSCLCP